MTGRTTRSRRFKRSGGKAEARWPARAFLLLTVLSPAWAPLAPGGRSAHATTARGARQAPIAKLPVIQNVGVIPVQWEGGESSEDTTPGQQALAEAFPEAVRTARRFRVLSDDLVATAWNTADGRAELKSQFELHAFLSLTVAPRGDTLALTARLLDPALKTDLLETEQVAADWLAGADKKAVLDRVEGLVFRLLNRIPVDVSVTSVQGPFITLSGGSEQGVEVGDKVDLVRTGIRSLHPANGTWLEFQKQTLGTAQIVDVKTYTSVARLTALTYDNAVEVGDGARIGAIATRVKFARLAANDGYQDAGDQDTILVPPVTLGSPTAAAAAPARPAAPAAPAAAAESPARAPSTTTAQVDAPPAADAPSPNETPPPDDKGPSMWDDVTHDVTSHRVLDTIDGYAGPYAWSVAGPANDSGKFPLWLVNSVGAGVTRTLLYNIKTAFGGGIVFGQTEHSHYEGYDGYGRIYWEDGLEVGDGLIKGWRAGGLGRVSGIAVDSGLYGGGDWLRGGGFGALFGSLRLGERNDRYDWFAELALVPLNIGRVGYNGSRKTVQSAFGTGFSLGAYRYDQPRVVQWGGGIDYSDEHQTLDNNRILHSSSYSLKLLAKYAL